MTSMLVAAAALVIIEAIIGTTAGPGLSKLNTERRIEYVAIWTGEDVTNELAPHIDNLLENSIEGQRQTLVVDSEVSEVVKTLINERSRGVYKNNRLTILTEQDVFDRYRDKAFETVLSATDAEQLQATYAELPKRMRRGRRDALVLAYLSTIGDVPTFVHEVDTKFGIDLDGDGTWNRIETFKEEDGDVDPEYGHKRTDHVTSVSDPEYLRLRGMRNAQFSVYGNSADGTNYGLASRSYLTDVPNTRQLERRNMKFTTDMIYAPSAGSIADIALQSIVIRKTLDQITYKVADGTTYTIKDIINGPPSGLNDRTLFTDTVTGDAWLRLTDISTRYENSVLLAPIEGMLQTVFSRDYYSQDPQLQLNDYVEVDPYGLVGDIRLSGQYEGVRNFMRRTALDTTQFAVSMDLQLDAEISIPDINFFLPDPCDSGFESNKRRRKRSSGRRGGKGCLLNADDYDISTRKFRRKYEYKYDAVSSSVKVWSQRAVWIVKHPRVVAKVFAQHAKRVSLLSKTVEKALAAHEVVIETLIKRLPPSDVSIDSVSRLMKAHGVSDLGNGRKKMTAKGSKSVVRWLSFVSVMMGTNDLRASTNGSNEDFNRVFAISDITESTFQLLAAVVPTKATPLLGVLANNKVLGRFNSFGQIFQTLDLTRSIIQNGGVRSPEEVYWAVRAAMNTISIASRTLGRIFLPLIAVDISMILKSATDTARTTLHETMTELHLTPDQRSALYWDGFIGDAEDISEFRKAAAMKRGIEENVVKATEILTRMSSAKAVVIPFRRGPKVVNVKRFVSKGASYGAVFSSCQYREVEDSFKFVYGIDKDSSSIDYTTVNYSSAIPTKLAFRGDEKAFDRCIELTGSYCRYADLSFTEQYALNNHHQVKMVPVKLSRCPITGDDGKDIVFRPADDYMEWCELEERLKTEKVKRRDKIVSIPLRPGESDALTRPSIPKSSSREFDLVDFPYGSMREYKGPEITEYHSFNPRRCAPEGKTKYSQTVTNVLDSPSDLIVSATEKSEEAEKKRDRVVFYPVTTDVVLPDKSIAYLYYPDTSLGAGTDSLVVATDVKKTYGSKLHVTNKFSGRLSLIVTAGRGDKMVINTDRLETDIPGLFENATITKLYLEMLTRPKLSANWLDALYASDVDGGLLFVGPMTRYVRVGKSWTVVTYGDFANVVIEVGLDTTVYQTSERSMVQVVKV